MGSRDDNPTDAGDPTTEQTTGSVTYTEGEKVLAYHDPHIYEAKIQKVEKNKETQERRYFVHYLGWSKNWDEWVGLDRLMKLTEENIRKQEALGKKLGADKTSKSGRTTQVKPKSSTETKGDKEDLRNNVSVSKSKKRKAESGKEDTVPADKHVKIQIPATLKKLLIDDCTFVTQLGKLVKLPRVPSIDQIIHQYLAYQSTLEQDGMVNASLPEVLKGLRDYFNKALVKLLLYKKEYQQYDEAISDKILPSTVYGAEHLLRLYVKLPDLLANVTIDEETLPKLQQELQEFLKYIHKNQASFFLNTYEDPNGESGTVED